MNNKIICGDVLDGLSKIESNISALILTSPPYFNQREYLTIKYLKEIGREKTIDAYLSNLYKVFEECLRVCKDDGSIVFNIGDVYINKSLQLIPYRFALGVLNRFDVKLINDITWVKTNPTPRQYNKRLIPSTEPFFHFVKSDKYYYNRNEFLQTDKVVKYNNSPKKGQGYIPLIQSSELTESEKLQALLALQEAILELHEGHISDFRMKIRGVHKKAFGGQSGGRNNQIDKQGYTIIKFTGNKIKRDVIESPVANTKNIDHPAVFPLKVIAEVVKLLSIEDNVILDPFCGSGQVCLAAKSLNRNSLGIDLNPEYCKMAEKRLSELIAK